MFDKILGIGKKLSALGTGNPATIATSFAPPDSPFGKAASAGMAFAGAGGGLKGLGAAAASQGDNPMSRALALRNQIEGIAPQDEAPAVPSSAPPSPRFNLGVNTDLGGGQLPAMRQRRGH